MSVERFITIVECHFNGEAIVHKHAGHAFMRRTGK